MHIAIVCLNISQKNYQFWRPSRRIYGYQQKLKFSHILPGYWNVHSYYTDATNIHRSQSDRIKHEHLLWPLLFITHNHFPVPGSLSATCKYHNAHCNLKFVIMIHIRYSTISEHYRNYWNSWRVWFILWNWPTIIGQWLIYKLTTG